MSDWTHTTTLLVEIDGQEVSKEYRWRLEADLDSYGLARITAEHRREGGCWCSVRSPDRLAQLRGLSGGGA